MKIQRRLGAAVGGGFLLGLALLPAHPAEAQSPVDWWVDAVAGTPLTLNGWEVQARVVVGGGARTPAPSRRSGGWGGGHDEYEVVVVRDDRRGSPRGSARRGPPFCESRAGHPVHGWRWCAERGYSRGPVWRRVDPGGLYFDRVSRSGGTFGTGELRRILGREAVEDLRWHARRMGLRDDLEGRWMHAADRRVRVLQVRSRGVPLAEFRDMNGDRWVDVMLLAMI